MTFSRVIIDFTGGVFAGGQAYVALSRCTSLDGICLKREITRADVFVRPEIVSFAQKFNDSQAIDRAMKQAQADIEYAASVQAFDKGDFETFLHHFFKAIHSRYDIEKPLQQRFIRKKLGIINKLKSENARLKEEMRESKKNLQKYAKEYYLMGNECVTQAHDTRAALANYDKAYNRGKLRLHIHDIEGAVTDLDKATSLKPQHAGAHECFADALMQAGKETEAEIHYRLAEEIKKKARH